jgi:hypothetical protein
MKKITVLILALALAVPVQAIPVRKKIVGVQKTNYSALAGACAITGLAVCAITAVVVYNAAFKSAKNKLINEWRKNEGAPEWQIKERVMLNVNRQLNPLNLMFEDDILYGFHTCHQYEDFVDGLDSGPLFKVDADAVSSLIESQYKA